MEAFSSKTDSSQIVFFFLANEMSSASHHVGSHLRGDSMPSVAKEMIGICFGLENEGLYAKFRDLQIKKGIL